MTRDNILCYLDNCREPENEDLLHKRIDTHNRRLVILFRFFKWLHYPNIEDSKRRSELSTLERKPDCIIGTKQLKRKEVSCYKPSDLWSQEDDLVFLKWVTNKTDRCYHTMTRDLSATPHEILNLKIKDVVFKAVGNKQSAEVLVNSKTGSRHISYVKEWLSNHLCRNNPNSPLFVGLGRNSMRKQLSNESSESLLEAYGIVTKNNVPIDILNHKICPNCNEGNTQDARCKMIMSLEGYHEVLQEQQEKDKDLQSVKERMASIENVLVAIQPLLQNLKPEMLSRLQLVGINNE
jgi:hypothetical protein